jgi:hypothetical protein
MWWIPIFLVGAGLYLIIDGIGSIVIYRNQTSKEHIPRVLRAGVGLALIALTTIL